MSERDESRALKYVAYIGQRSIGEELGITPDEIKNIVHGFYAKVQRDDILGPVFASEMSEDWDHHLDKMVNFWTTVLFAEPLYKGNPLEVHAKVSDIGPGHFDRWLSLFDQTLREFCPNDEHFHAFSQRAHNMGRVMTTALAMRPAR
jgi:hemoglobin